MGARSATTAIATSGAAAAIANAIVTLATVFVVVALVTDGRVEAAQARGLAAAALMPAGFLAVRASSWLVVSNMLAIVALIGVAILFARSGSVLDTTPVRILRRIEPAIWRGLTSP